MSTFVESFRKKLSLLDSNELNNGYDEFKKLCKHGNEFSKEVAGILHERFEVENVYAKSLNKLSAKLTKAVSSSSGTLAVGRKSVGVVMDGEAGLHKTLAEGRKSVLVVMDEEAGLHKTLAEGRKSVLVVMDEEAGLHKTLAEGWKSVGVTMDEEAGLHKNFATNLLDEICKPLKSLVDAHIKSCKPIEETVIKATKIMQEKKSEEIKSRKHCYCSSKEYEKLVDNVGTTKTKDASKFEKRSQACQDAVEKADNTYMENNYSAQMSCHEWQLTISKASTQLQHMEEERIGMMNVLLSKYDSNLSVFAPRLSQIHTQLNEAVLSVNLPQDIQALESQKEPTQPEYMQHGLIDCYAEDMQFTMESERRMTALKRYLMHIHRLIERDRKGKEGVKKLVEVYKNNENFSHTDSQEETKQKLLHNNIVSLLKVPMMLASSDNSPHSARYSLPNCYAEPTMVDEDFEKCFASIVTLLNGADDFDDHPTPIGRCRAMYDFDASGVDELSLRKGDVVTVYEKLGDGWSSGELSGRSGVFPSAYVEDV